MVFEHGGFGGKSQFLPLGSFGPNQLFMNDAISSALVSHMTKVIFHDNFPMGGNRLEIKEDSVVLPSGMNDRISGVEVVSMLAALIFKEPYFSGKSQVRFISELSFFD